MSEINNDMVVNEIGFHSISDIISCEEINEFYVAPYQRGYRWGENEIHYLLNDIWNAQENKKYSLQPVAVKKSDNKKWEVVDGQQRLTTIFLILSVLKNKHQYNQYLYELTYETRESTAEFLNKIKEGKFNQWGLENSDIEEQWAAFIKKNQDSIKDNIDNFHLFQAFLIIQKWFEEKKKDMDNNFIENFCKKLLEKTHIIWHPVSVNGESVEDRFININAGKIKLTDAELIKALFVLKIQKGDEPWDIKQMHIKQLAEEWDTIEKQLHDDAFWFFVSNSEEENYQTRIGLLFHLLSSKRDAKESSYQWFAEDSIRLNWDNVLKLYYRLLEWYEDVETYHKIGFLINARIQKIEELIIATDDILKTEIQHNLEGFIKKKIHSKKTRDAEEQNRFQIENLNYEDDKEDCQTLLLLYNILLLENTYPGQRFPFHFYRKQSWSLEHIHPQNPKNIKDKEHAKSWLEDYKSRYTELNDKNEDVDELKNELDDLKAAIENNIDKNLSQEVQEQLTLFAEKYKDDFELHGIGNLVLLDKQTNSSLNNHPFKDKRESILKHEKGRYIPLGTLNCFLKKHTSKKNVQQEFWSQYDIEAYKDSIESILKEYLPATENQE